tara:strand:- start:101 stop:685 length:585 start_codon:yes stop_codon:yes gene_type:complete
MVKSTIYKIVCKYPLVTDCYVGRTKDVTSRSNQHHVCCNSEKSKAYNYKLYKMIRANGGFDNWIFVEIETIEHADDDTILAREREAFWYHELNATLNNNVPNQSTQLSKSIWKKNNPEYASQYSKQYALKNKDAIILKSKIYYEKHKEQMHAATTKWVQANREKNRAYQRERYRISVLAKKAIPSGKAEEEILL